MVHIPILRAGRPYYSMDTVTLKNFITGEAVAAVSHANGGLISKDIARAHEYKQVMEGYSVTELLQICKRAAHVFAGSDLPLGEHSQTPENYVLQTSATTGMPQALCRKNMAKIFLVLENMTAVVEGLTRHLETRVLDEGFAEGRKEFISYMPLTNILGAILPNNSPGVHTLWLPAIPLKTPLALKPGREEPWTPYRIAQAFIAAGAPPEAFGFYPTDHSGAAEILLKCGRLMLFGDESTVAKWSTDRRIQPHGPGRSKIIIGMDQLPDRETWIDVAVTSIVENGGRSCINASGLWVPHDGPEIADSLAQILANIQPLAMDDPEAQLASFTNPVVAQRVNQMIEQLLKVPGAEDVTAKYRRSDRLVRKDGCTFLLPTVLFCSDPQHPLANTEFLFPFCSVVQAPQNDIPNLIGPTLVVTAITEDEHLIQDLLASRDVDRLNVGRVPTNQISWYQPHEGNLFEHLYRQRAFYTQRQAANY